MNLQQIQYFKVIAELEHYTRAAEKLLISQPSLSYAMSELELELGAPLFRKVGRGVTLTKYGKSFLQHAERSLRELEEGKEEIAQENLVTWKKSCASRPEVEELFRKAKITPRIAYEVQDEVMITGIVAKGLGVGIVPRLLGRDYENVKMLEIEGLEASRTMYMIWPQNQFFSPASEKFRDFVIRHMEEFQEDTGKF